MLLSLTSTYSSTNSAPKKVSNTSEGAGVLVKRYIDGLEETVILTCAHCIMTKSDQEEINVDVNYFNNKIEKSFTVKAKVNGVIYELKEVELLEFVPTEDGDLALLSIGNQDEILVTSDLIPSSDIQMNSDYILIAGAIRGHINSTEEEKFKFQIVGEEIKEGFSGGGICKIGTKEVVGIVAQKFNTEESKIGTFIPTEFIWKKFPALKKPFKPIFDSNAKYKISVVSSPDPDEDFSALISSISKVAKGDKYRRGKYKNIEFKNIDIGEVKKSKTDEIKGVLERHWRECDVFLLLIENKNNKFVDSWKKVQPEVLRLQNDSPKKIVGINFDIDYFFTFENEIFDASIFNSMVIIPNEIDHPSLDGNQGKKENLSFNSFPSFLKVYKNTLFAKFFLDSLSANPILDEFLKSFDFKEQEYILKDKIEENSGKIANLILLQGGEEWLWPVFIKRVIRNLELIEGGGIPRKLIEVIGYQDDISAEGMIQNLIASFSNEYGAEDLVELFKRMLQGKRNLVLVLKLMSQKDNRGDEKDIMYEKSVFQEFIKKIVDSLDKAASTLLTGSEKKYSKLFLFFCNEYYPTHNIELPEESFSNTNSIALPAISTHKTGLREIIGKWEQDINNTIDNFSSSNKYVEYEEMKKKYEEKLLNDKIPETIVNELKEINFRNYFGMLYNFINPKSNINVKWLNKVNKFL